MKYSPGCNRTISSVRLHAFESPSTASIHSAGSLSGPLKISKAGSFTWTPSSRAGRRKAMPLRSRCQIGGALPLGSLGSPYSGRTCDGEPLLRRARAPLFLNLQQSRPSAVPNERDRPSKQVLEFPILVRVSVETRLALVRHGDPSVFVRKGRKGPRPGGMCPQVSARGIIRGELPLSLRPSISHRQAVFVGVSERNSERVVGRLP